MSVAPIGLNNLSSSAFPLLGNLKRGGVPRDAVNEQSFNQAIRSKFAPKFFGQFLSPNRSVSGKTARAARPCRNALEAGPFRSANGDSRLGRMSRSLLTTRGAPAATSIEAPLA